MRPTTAIPAPRSMWDAPQGFSRAAEKMTAASPMSSTIRGAGGPTGTGCSASRSPSTTPTVSKVASRLNGAPPTGARDSATGERVFGVVVCRQRHPAHRGQDLAQGQFGRQRHIRDSTARRRPRQARRRERSASPPRMWCRSIDCLTTLLVFRSLVEVEVSGQLRLREPRAVGQRGGEPFDRGGDRQWGA